LPPEEANVVAEKPAAVPAGVIILACEELRLSSKHAVITAHIRTSLFIIISISRQVGGSTQYASQAICRRDPVPDRAKL
jgi:hypothetical protein